MRTCLSGPAALVFEDLERAGVERTPLGRTLTGLADRAHLGGPHTDLGSHINDITDLVQTQDLRNVTLVAHSYTAASVTGAAGRLGDRLQRVMYVDSAPFAAGMSMLDLVPPQVADQWRQQVNDAGNGRQLALPPIEVLGMSNSLDGLDDVQRERLDARATAQPFGTYTERLTNMAELGPKVDRVLFACRDFTALLDAGIPALAYLNQPPWRRFDLATGHWPMLSAPVDLGNVLHAAVT